MVFRFNESQGGNQWNNGARGLIIFTFLQYREKKIKSNEHVTRFLKITNRKMFLKKWISIENAGKSIEYLKPRYGIIL